MALPSKNAELLAAYSEEVATYVTKTPDTLPNLLTDWLDAGLGDGAPGSLLEIGAGGGVYARYIRDTGWSDLLLTDGAQGFVDHLRENGFSNSEVLNILTDPIEGTYDVVLLAAVLLHFTDEEVAIAMQKCVAALETGGRLIVSVKRGAGEVYETNKLGKERYFHYWEPDEFRELLESYGLKITFMNEAFEGYNGYYWILAVGEKEEPSQ